MGENVRAHVVISGKVQGVFFRVETKRAADEFGVCGWVRNLKNGSVEAVMEGQREVVDNLISWCRTGPPMAAVDQLDIDMQAYSGTYDSFDIRL